MLVSGFDIRGTELRQDEIKSKDQEVKNGSSTDTEKERKTRCDRLKNSPPKNIHVKSLEHMSATLFGKRLFADVITLRILR